MSQNELTPCHLPSKATLRKYGLSLEEWLEIYRRQEGRCAICGKLFEDKRVNVDHAHVPGFKKMAPEQRKLYVRGLLDYQCNKFMVMRGVTANKLYHGWIYLKAHEKRLGNMQKGQQVLKRRNIRHPNQEQNQERHPG